MVRLIDQLRTALIAGVDRVQTTLRPRLAGWRAQRRSLWEQKPQALWRAGRPLLVFAVAYVAAWSYLFVAAFLGATPPPAPLFPPGAVLLSAILLTPWWHWWRFLVAAFVIQVPILAQLHLPLWWNLLGYTADAIEPIIAASLMLTFIALPPRFATLREVSIYTLSVAVAVAIAATIGSAVTAVFGGEPYGTAWVSYYLSDVLACLVLAPAILLWIAAGFGGLRAGSHRRLAEAGLLYGGLLLLGVFVFDVRVFGPAEGPALIYLPVPLLLWASVRFAPRGVATALSLLIVLAIPAVANALGPFAGTSSPAAAVLGNILTLRLFLLVIGVPLFVLAALMQERAAAARTLRASETHYRTAVRNLPHSAVLLFDGGLRHSFADGPGLLALGLTSEGVEGQTVWDAFPGDLAAALLPHYEAALSGQTVAVDVEHAQKTLYVQAVPLPAATPATTEASESAAVPASAGMLLLQDVTDQRRARDELERERLRSTRLGALSQEFHTLAEHSPDLIARLDPGGRLRYVNQVGADLLGLPADQGIGRTFANSGIPPDVAAPLDQAVREVVANRAPRTFDIDVRSAEGKVHALHVRVVPELTEEGALESALAIATDVSALKEVEQLREEWTSVVAHDLRQPTTVILGYGSLLERSAAQFSPLVQLQVSHILDSARLLGRMIRDLLDSSRIETRRLTLERRDVDLAALVPVVVERAAEMTRSHVVAVTLRSKIRPINADPGRIEQVLTNLLTNAAKYGDPRSDINVTLDKEATAVKVGVTNRGPGIRPEELPTIFNRFIRTRTAQQRTREGLGLGLYIAKGLVEAHGGRIWVESTPGETTTFWFTLPIEPHE
jgi:PAS domain S-box-containing protein